MYNMLNNIFMAVRVIIKCLLCGGIIGLIILRNPGFENTGLYFIILFLSAIFCSEELIRIVMQWRDNK